MKFKKSIFIFFVFSFISVFSQDEFKYYDLRLNANFDSIKIKDERLDLHVIDYTNNGYGLDYTKALLNSWKLSKSKIDEKSKDRIQQALCFIGDIQTINRISENEINEKCTPKVVITADSIFKKYFSKVPIHLLDPKELILGKFKNNSIVMLNEAHDRPQTRAFLLNILYDLKEAGVTNLALETLNSKWHLNQIDYFTGHYTDEPLFGQVIREAIKLRF